MDDKNKGCSSEDILLRKINKIDAEIAAQLSAGLIISNDIRPSVEQPILKGMPSSTKLKSHNRLLSLIGEPQISISRYGKLTRKTLSQPESLKNVNVETTSTETEKEPILGSHQKPAKKLSYNQNIKLLKMLPKSRKERTVTTETEKEPISDSHQKPVKELSYNQNLKLLKMLPKSREERTVDTGMKTIEPESKQIGVAIPISNSSKSRPKASTSSAVLQNIPASTFKNCVHNATKKEKNYAHTKKSNLHINRPRNEAKPEIRRCNNNRNVPGNNYIVDRATFYQFQWGFNSYSLQYFERNIIQDYRSINLGYQHNMHHWNYIHNTRPNLF